MKPQLRRCAIYTRKSTEEGLEQDFNTLDAQREACQHFIASQRHEGWEALPDRYDDGGFTGGNMDRPALQRMMADIQAGKVDMVVVYKVDRLTRAMLDFSKLVEIFDKHQVTFVSITQAFNTATPMGRLTLNMLLSFAQFEREVIGERVRDKIAASKQKGMWMGGNNPVGYYRVNKQLVPRSEEVPFVTMLFERYLELGCVRRLVQELRETKVVSRAWTSSKGRQHGGAEYSRGAIIAILTNPVYIGKIRHKKKVYDGLHVAIIDHGLWERVQQQLKENTVSDEPRRAQDYLLQGKIRDSNGVLYSPVHTNKKGKRYRYYVSRNYAEFRDQPQGLIGRLAAGEIEDLVRGMLRDQFAIDTLAEMVGTADQDIRQIEYMASRAQELEIDRYIRRCCTAVTLGQDMISLTIDRTGLKRLLQEQFAVGFTAITEAPYKISSRYNFSRVRNGAIMLHAPRLSLANDDPFNAPDHEIQNWVKGTAWRDMHFAGKTIDTIAASEGVGSSYVSRLILRSLDAR